MTIKANYKAKSLSLTLIEFFFIENNYYIEAGDTLFARFCHKQDSQLNSSVLITVWRFVIENSVTGLPTK